MTVKTTTKLVRVGEYVAEVDVEFSGDGGEWSPTISVADATRLDHVREALRKGDLRLASQLAGRVYRLTPVALTDVR